jgi:hypothetical protein
MNTKLVEDIAGAVLYEGYLLYPYRASAIKNKQRWNFGVLYPRAFAEQQSGSDIWWTQTECLLHAGSNAKLNVRLRFLHLDAGPNTGNAQTARERDVALHGLNLGELALRPPRITFTFPPQPGQSLVEAAVETAAEPLGSDLYKLRVGGFNTVSFDGATRSAALQQSLISAHSILTVEDGEFVSLLEPPDEFRDAAAGCKNVGTWPVLVGDEGQRNAMLSSPIILYDYPKIAPESPGALFDGTEIDEILTLRIMTLTDQEKLEMGLTDERAREILERTESISPEQFMKMHGVLRGLSEVPGELP